MTQVPVAIKANPPLSGVQERSNRRIHRKALRRVQLNAEERFHVKLVTITSTIQSINHSFHLVAPLRSHCNVSVYHDPLYYLRCFFNPPLNGCSPLPRLLLSLPRRSPSNLPLKSTMAFAPTQTTWKLPKLPSKARKHGLRQSQPLLPGPKQQQQSETPRSSWTLSIIVPSLMDGTAS